MNDSAHILYEGRDLTCIRGEELIFTDLNFRIQAGEAVILTGPNGSGKSSLLRVLAGLLEEAAGHVLWQGVDRKDDREGYRSLLHYVGHADPVKPVLTVREHLQFFQDMGQASLSLDQAMHSFDLHAFAQSQGRILSSGQRRRMNLCRLLLDDRPLWLLDEPTVGLDQASCKALETIIAEHRRTGGIVIVSTHTGIDLTEPTQLDMAEFSARIREGISS